MNIVKKEVVSNDYAFSVRKETLTHNGMPVAGHCAIVREDNGRTIAVNGDKYGLIPHSQIIDLARSALCDRGVYKENIFVSHQGNRLHGMFDLMGSKQDVSVGDPVGIRLTFRNSYDGSLQASIQGGLMRLVCSNGMASFDKKSSLSLQRKHTQNIRLEDVSESIRLAIGKAEQDILLLKELASSPIEHEQGLPLLNAMSRKGFLPSPHISRIAEVWEKPSHEEDKPRNLYNLYNASTQYLTHELADVRFTNAQKISASVAQGFRWVKEIGVQDAILVA